MKATISVIIPVYKVEPYLDRCLQSVIKQSYTSLEIILVDDGSPDNSGEMCDTWAQKDSRIKVIHKENGGLSSARNTGLTIATGKYVFFVDSDDWITKDALAYLIQLIEDTDADIVSGSYVITDGSSKYISQHNKYRIMNREEALEYYLKIGMSRRISDYPAWGKLYKKELIDKIQFPVGQLYEDVATVYRLIMSCKQYVKSEKIIYYYYKNNNSITHNKFLMKDLDAIKVGEELVNESINENSKIQKYARQKMIRGYFSCICKMYMYGIDESVEQPEMIMNMCREKLKNNYWYLLFSGLPVSRKIVLSMICINSTVSKRILCKLGER